MENLKSLRSNVLQTAYEWCISNGKVPYICIRYTEPLFVLKPYVKDGLVTLNLGLSSAFNFCLDDKYLSFDATFNKTPSSLLIPIADISAIFPREHPYESISFNLSYRNEGDTETSKEEVKELKDKSFLKVIK